MAISHSRNVALPLINLLRLQGVPILQQLHLEERLLRTSSDNWCIINDGTNRPTTVMGVSGKPEELLHTDAVLRDEIPVVRRYTGGGTVIVDQSTIFVTFICNKDAIPGLQSYPQPIMSWSSLIYKNVFRGIGDFGLLENDYVLGNLKFGGNAQSITKNRWVHHTSFLWDYEISNMDYLKMPKRVPEYRQARNHQDFVCRMKDYIPRSSFIDRTMNAVGNYFVLRSVEAEGIQSLSASKFEASSRLLTKQELGGSTCESPRADAFSETLSAEFSEAYHYYSLPLCSPAPATFYHSSAASIRILADCSGKCNTSWFHEGSSVHRRLDFARCQWQRYATRSGKKDKVVSKVDALSFIRSWLHQPRGPSHCWLNTIPGRDNMFKVDGIFLVVVGDNERSPEAYQNTVKMVEKAKLLQQRYPFLQVMALKFCPSVFLDDISSHLWQIIREYITFPILLSNKNTPEEANAPCLIISKGFHNPIVYRDNTIDLTVLYKAINDLNAGSSKNPDVIDVKSTWDKPIEVVKEPNVCSASRNLLFSFPGCISVDESSDRLFLSDVNHHRIIVLNTNGKILDVIGSSPGFEDGEFEMTKLMRPAASFYDSSEDCLYFVDSENHAIRRADMDTRVVETVFPVRDGSLKKGLWQWVLDKIWTKGNIKPMSKEYDFPLLLFPWHLLKSSETDIFVLNQSFGTLWIVDLKSGIIKEVIEESPKILEICGQMILEKCDPLGQLPGALLKQQVDTYCSLKGIPYGNFMSSAASFRDYIVFCGEVGGRVVKFNKSGTTTTLCMSNFGNLGLPYWLTLSIEKLYSVAGPSEINVDHSECFHLLPGRVDISLIVDTPKNTDLVELPQEGCIWRQTRGAAAETSGVDKKTASSEKVSISQTFYDDLDNLIYSKPEEEPTIEVENQPPRDELQEGRVRIACTINTSPGTSELIVYAALYLRLKKNSNSQADSQAIKAARIADILEPKRKSKRDLLVNVLMMSDREMEEVVFLRPLHVKLKFNCENHPNGDHSKEVVLTNSSVEAHITL